MAGLTIGLAPKRVTAAPEFGIGSFGARDDSEFIYVHANAAIAATGAVVVLTSANRAHELTTAVDVTGRRIGIAPGPVVSGEYFWAQVRGEAEFLAAANCAANADLRATAAGGVVDDAGAGPYIDGMITVEAAGAMQSLVKGRLTYPTLQSSTAGGAAVPPDLSTWDLVWQAGALTSDRLASVNDNAFRTTDRDLIAGKTFASYRVMVAWIDNSGNKEGKFMYIPRQLWQDEFSYVQSGGGWADWSDNRWIGLSYESDTAFRFRGNGMGLRRLFGIV